jgi:hypothetical protein
MDRKTESNSTDEIEITPEMIEAGNGKSEGGSTNKIAYHSFASHPLGDLIYRLGHRLYEALDYASPGDLDRPWDKLPPNEKMFYMEAITAVIDLSSADVRFLLTHNDSIDRSAKICE